MQTNCAVKAEPHNLLKPHTAPAAPAMWIHDSSVLTAWVCDVQWILLYCVKWWPEEKTKCSQNCLLRLFWCSQNTSARQCTLSRHTMARVTKRWMWHWSEAHSGLTVVDSSTKTLFGLWVVEGAFFMQLIEIQSTHRFFFKSLFSCISVLCTDNVALGSQKNSVATNKISRLKTDAVRNLRTWEALIKTVKWKSVPASEASFACVHICDHFVHYSPTLHDLLTGHYLSSLASIWPCNPAAVALVSVLGSTVTQADTMVAL